MGGATDRNPGQGRSSGVGDKGKATMTAGEMARELRLVTAADLLLGEDLEHPHPSPRVQIERAHRQSREVKRDPR